MTRFPRSGGAVDENDGDDWMEGVRGQARPEVVRDDPPATAGGDDAVERLMRELVQMLRPESGSDSMALIDKIADRRKRERDENRQRNQLDLSGMTAAQKLHLGRLPAALQPRAAMSMEIGSRRNALKGAGLDPDRDYAKGIPHAGTSAADYIGAVRKSKSEWEQRAAERKKKNAEERAARMRDPNRKPGSLSAITHAPGGGFKGHYQVGKRPLSATSVGGLDATRSAVSSGLQQQTAEDAMLRAIERMAGGLGGFG